MSVRAPLSFGNANLLKRNVRATSAKMRLWSASGSARMPAVPWQISEKQVLASIARYPQVHSRAAPDTWRQLHSGIVEGRLQVAGDAIHIRGKAGKGYR